MTYETILEAVCGDSDVFERLVDRNVGGNVNENINEIITNDDIKNCISNSSKNSEEMINLENMVIRRLCKKINDRAIRCKDAIDTNVAKFSCNSISTKMNMDMKQLHELQDKIIDINENPSTYSEDEIIEIYKKIMAPSVMRDAILKHELCKYIPKEFTVCDRNKKVEISNKIKHDIDKFHSLSPLYPVNKNTETRDYCFHHYEWMIDYEDTMNYEVPKNTVLFTNTIDTNSYDNDDNIINRNLDNYLESIIRYLKKKYKSPKIKKYIIESDKYEVCWVFIMVRFY